MTRPRRLLIAATTLLLALAILATLLFRERVQRRRVFRPAATAAKPAPGKTAIPPVAQWTAAFTTLGSAELKALLEAIETSQPDLYRKHSLAYLHARILVDEDDRPAAAAKLAPFVAKGHPFRKLALYHLATISDAGEASSHRNTLMADHPDSLYRSEAIEDEVIYLASLDGPQALTDFSVRVAPSLTTDQRRELGARIVEALVEADQLDNALARGLTLLAAGTTDDAADRVTRSLDLPGVHPRLTTAQLELFGETMQRHRHYDRAIVLLKMAMARAPARPPAPKAQAKPPARKQPAKKAPAKTPADTKAAAPASRLDELQFALGRSHFGAEQYVEAEQAYRAGAATGDLRMKATFLWHAARAAQLRGDDQAAERLMTEAIGVKGNYPSTLAALTQRLRTRVRQRRLQDAIADHALIRRMAANERAFVEASLALAVGSLGMDRAAFAHGVLAAVPANRLDPYDRAEFAYWTARSLEAADPPEAFRAYLQVLRSEVPTHFAYFARKRLDSAALNAKVTRELAVREAQVTNLLAAKNFELAKDIQTDRVLLSSRDREKQLRILASIYRELPLYRAVMELEPESLPKFPEVDPGKPDALLMAMGLHDEAVLAIEQRFPLTPAKEALSRSYALQLGGASKASIYAIEVMMKRVPQDFHPELLPEVVRQLLYPRYFYEFIAEDAERYKADPALLLSIMREESRFNPRAKSQAAARGLLQFIITTARDIGRDAGLVDVSPEDLYDPRIIIRLGAKYLSELSTEFSANRYRIAAAYNAGPKQAALWSRLQPAEGDDYFLTAVNFDETKHYVRKVTNSYERYGEIYDRAGPTGGLRAEP